MNHWTVSIGFKWVGIPNCTCFSDVIAAFALSLPLPPPSCVEDDAVDGDDCFEVDSRSVLQNERTYIQYEKLKFVYAPLIIEAFVMLPHT